MLEVETGDSILTANGVEGIRSPSVWLRQEQAGSCTGDQVEVNTMRNGEMICSAAGLKRNAGNVPAPQ